MCCPMCPVRSQGFQEDTQDQVAIQALGLGGGQSGAQKLVLVATQEVELNLSQEFFLELEVSIHD